MARVYIIKQHSILWMMWLVATLCHKDCLTCMPNFLTRAILAWIDHCQQNQRCVQTNVSNLSRSMSWSLRNVYNPSFWHATFNSGRMWWCLGMLKVGISIFSLAQIFKMPAQSNSASAGQVSRNRESGESCKVRKTWSDYTRRQDRHLWILFYLWDRFQPASWMAEHHRGM